MSMIDIIRMSQSEMQNHLKDMSMDQLMVESQNAEAFAKKLFNSMTATTKYITEVARVAVELMDKERAKSSVPITKEMVSDAMRSNNASRN